MIGTVRDGESGAAVAGATVRLEGYATRADAGGGFGFERLRGAQRVAAEAEGFYPVVQPVAWAWWQKEVRVDLRLRPMQLTGEVMDAWTGAPVAGATIEAHPAAQGVAGGLTAQSDTAGRFVLARAAPPAELRASAPGYLAWSAAVTGYHAFAPDFDWRVSLTPNTVTGRVYAADSGEPLPGTGLQLDEQSATAGAEGGFRLHRVGPGAAVRVTPPGDYAPASAVYPGHGELVVAVEPRRLVVTALDGGSGAPLPETVAFVSGISRTLGAGGAQFERLAPGTRVQLRHPDYLITEVTYQGEPELAVTLRPYALQGVVRDRETGRPVPGASVHAGDQAVEADASGYYRLPELPGEASLAVKAPGFRLATLTWTDAISEATSPHAEAASCAEEASRPGALCLDLRLTPFQPRGIYIPFGLLAYPDTVRGLLDLIDATELNALVVDVKGDRGYLAYDSRAPLADELGVDAGREGWLTLEELLAEAEARDIYTVARMVVFKDHPLALGRPELAVQRADGSVWTDGEGLGWGDPFREEVWDYNISLAQEVAGLGFDEVQFDYLRFPSDGAVGAIAFAEENTAETRTAAIREFTRRAGEALRPYSVFTSADVFGLTVWVEPESDMSIGQRVMDIAPHVDYLCPMVYPSTFRPGNLGYADPSAHPYDVIYRSQEAGAARVPPGTRVRPWLQAYWYPAGEMLMQKQAAEDAGAAGWTFWNAGGDYPEELFDVESRK
jgi:hypothetical protein